MRASHATADMIHDESSTSKNKPCYIVIQWPSDMRTLLSTVKSCHTSGKQDQPVYQLFLMTVSVATVLQMSQLRVMGSE